MIMATFTIGQRVGILVGQQSVNGPSVGSYGIVVRTEEFWKGTTDYIVRSEATGEELVYSAYMLQNADGDAAADRMARARSMRAHPAGKGRVPTVGDLMALVTGNPWDADTVLPLPGTTWVGGLPVTRNL